MASRQEAIEQLQNYAALEEAEATKLVDAVIDVAQQEAIDAIVDEDLAPTSIAARNIARVAAICQNANISRLLTPGEVEVILRVPRSTATRILNQVCATYPRRVDGWIRQQVKSTAGSPVDKSTLEDGALWSIPFSDVSALDYAVELLRRQGMTKDLQIRRRSQELVVPKKMPDRRRSNRSPLAVLGIEEP